MRPGSRRLHAAMPAEDVTCKGKLQVNARLPVARYVFPPSPLADPLPRQRFGAVLNRWRPSDIGLRRHER